MNISAATQNLRLMVLSQVLSCAEQSKRIQIPKERKACGKVNRNASYIHWRLILQTESSFHSSKYSYCFCGLSLRWQTCKLQSGSSCWVSHKPVLLFTDTKFNCVNTNRHSAVLGFRLPKCSFSSQCLLVPRFWVWYALYWLCKSTPFKILQP